MTLSFFVHTKPENPLNGSLSGAHWSKKRRWSNLRREAAARVMYAEMRGKRPPWPAAQPKAVTFTVHSHNAFDSDGRQAACKPYRDALRDMGLINDDRDSAGHSFDYRQVISRGKAAKHGVQIDVTIRAENVVHL